jgi:hypothetical protein
MSLEAEPGSETVTARTRAFEEIDAQVFAGPGRGATRAEAAASDRWGGPSPATAAAYRRMVDLVVKHQLAHGARRSPTTRHPLSNTASEPVQTRSRALSHHKQTATNEEDRGA